MMKNSFIKPPQADLIQKLSRKDLTIHAQQQMASSAVGPPGALTQPQSKTNKMVDHISSNITV